MAMPKYKKMAFWGIGLFVYSFVLQYLILPAAIKMALKKQASLKQGSQMREMWGKIPFALYFDFHIFNVTNPDEIQEGAKPMLQEVGPYCYDQWQEKTNQVDHEEDDTVSYTFKNTYYFNKTRSNGLTGHEEIIVPNLFILGLINTVLKEKPTFMPIVAKAVNSIFKNPDSIFMKVKVKDLLFDGIMIDCRVKDTAGSGVCKGIKDNHEEFGLPMIEEDVYMFSLFGARNGTDEKERFRVLRGLKKMKDVGMVVEYNGKPNISTWNDEFCDKFRGTDSTVYHPFFDPKGKDDMIAFNGGVCRNLVFHFDSKSKVAGMKTLRYTTSLGTDGMKNPAEKCYCEAPDNCLKKGVFDAYKCLGQPLVFSNPHFYLADPYYQNAVKGLKPNKEKHMMILDLEPVSGAPVYAHTGAQVNFFIMPVAKFKLMKTFPEALLPLFWIEVTAILPDYLHKQIRDGVRQLKMTKIFRKLLTFGGLGLCCYASYLYYKTIQGEGQSVKQVKITEPKKRSDSDYSNGSDVVENKTNVHVISLRPAPVHPLID